MSVIYYFYCTSCRLRSYNSSIAVALLLMGDSTLCSVQYIICIFPRIVCWYNKVTIIVIITIIIFFLIIYYHYLIIWLIFS